MIPYFQITTINLGPLSIQAWGTLVALGFLAGILVDLKRAKSAGFKKEQIIDLAFWIVLSSMVFGRVVYVAGHLPDYLATNSWRMFYFWEGGMTVFGGFIGAVIAYIIFVKKKKLPFWKFGDVVIFGLPLGLAIGRVGCFLIHDHIGKPTDFFLGMQYLDGLTRHENALYLVINAALLFLVYLLVDKYYRHKFSGLFVVVFMLWYGFFRFWLDFLRATDLAGSDPRYWGLTGAQYASILLFFGGTYLFWRLNPRASKCNNAMNRVAVADKTN